MNTHHPVPGFTYKTLSSVWGMFPQTPFRLHDTSPFILQGRNQQIDVSFMHNGQPVVIGSLFTHTNALVVDTTEGLGAEVHAGVLALAPSVAGMIKTAELRVETSRQEMIEMAFEMMGPRDQNRKTVEIPGSRKEMLSLAFFAGYLNAALPGRMNATRVDYKTHRTFHLHVTMTDDYGTVVPIFAIKSGNTNLTLETLVEGEKPRLMFVENIFADMRARRERVVSDPDLLAAMDAVRVQGNESPLYYNGQRSAQTAEFFAHTTDYMGLTSSSPYAYDSTPGGTDTFVKVEVAPNLFGVILSRKDRSSFCGIEFKGEPIATQVGVLAGIDAPRDLYYGVREATARARPDLLSQDAFKMGFGVDEAQTHLAESVSAALRGPFQVPDVPVIEL